MEILDEKARIAAIAGEIAEILSLNVKGLRKRWQAVFGKPPSIGLTGDILARMLTWNLQEEAYGGHSREVLKLLDAAAKGGVSSLGRRLKLGTQIIREFDGVRHTVTVTAGGFEWEGKTYLSLTAIARLITGTNWNGPRFFGLRDRGEAAGKSKKVNKRAVAGRASP